jgi:hypothetical protein
LCVSSCLVCVADARRIDGPAASPAETAADEVTGQFDGVVVDVQGTIFTLEGGIGIDASNASISTITTGLLDVSSIKPGMSIRASVNGQGDVSAPFVARHIRLRVPGEIILTGRIQEVDVETNESGQITGGVIRILDRRFQVQFLQTVGIRKKNLRIGRHVLIVAIENGGVLSIKAIFPGLKMGVFIP